MVASGDVIGGFGGGGSVAITGPGDRFLWSGGAAVFGGEQTSSGRLVGSLSRPVGARASAGGGVHASLRRSDGDTSELSIAIDLGIARSFGATHGAGRTTVHGALLDIGPESLREAVTPVVGADTTVWSDRGRSVDLSVAATGRTAESIAIGAAAAFSWEDRLRLSASLSLLEGDDFFPAIPGLRLDLRIPLGSRFDSRAGVFFAPAAGGESLAGFDVDTVIVSRDDTPPEIVFGTEESIPAVVSPAGEYRVVEVTVESRDDRAIGFLDLWVERGDGEVLRRSRIYPPALDWGEMTLSDRLSQRLRSDVVAGEIVWNAAPNESDGTILFYAAATDTAGNTVETEIAQVHVDATPPEMDGHFVAYDGGGSELSQLHLVTSGEVYGEVTVDGAERSRFEIIDEASRPVRELIPESINGISYSLRWNGAGDDGYRVDNGLYRVRAVATDAAGNEGRYESGTITVRGLEPDLSIALSSHTLGGDGAGSSREILARPRLEPVLGLRDWTLDLVKIGGSTIRSWSGIDLLPEAIPLSDLNFPEDGEYLLSGRAVYLDGEIASAESGVILVDRSPPSISVAASRSRVRRGIDTTLPVFLETGPDAAITNVELNRDGQLLRTVSTRRRSPTIELPLVNGEGRSLLPGLYTIVVRTEDVVGNVASSDPLEFEVLPGDIGAQIIAERSIFSPNDDGVQDRLPIHPTVSEERTVGEYVVTISDSAGDVVVRRSGGTVPPSTIEWDGRDAAGRPVDDGRYSITMEVLYQDGSRVRSNGETVIVDTRIATPDVEIAGATISPDGDGRLDELVIQLGSVDDDVVERFLTVRQNGAVLARRPVDSPGTIRWIPRTVENLPLPDGEYRLSYELADDAGNTIRSQGIPFSVVTRPVSAYVSLSQPYLSPNGDDLDDDIGIRPVIPDREGMLSWTIEIAGTEGGRIVRRYRGDGSSVPEELRWNGVTETGRPAEDGVFLARLVAEWEWGARVDIASVPFVLDRTPPEIDLRVRPRRFSPDDDGIDDRLYFEPTVRDTSALRFWYLEILDPQGRFFYDDGGSGSPPRRIIWDGYARNGERVVSAGEYRWIFHVTDDLGNESSAEGVIQTDVLVERTDRGYRIQVPGITFLPNSATLVLDASSPEGQQNIAVLDRIVEILDRYPDYAVIVEGHAVNVTGTEREQREELLPLSLSRAQSVRDALINRGVQARRLEAAGRGGEVPNVPHTDEQNRWKNRRVEFLLVR